MKGWIGVDLDGTLAVYERWGHPLELGPPVKTMVVRVRRWIAQGEDVRIFTARIGPRQEDLDAHGVTVDQIRLAIEAWCYEHIGCILPVTNVKDSYMHELWDDRAVQVERNTGRVIGKSTRGLT